PPRAGAGGGGVRRDHGRRPRRAQRRPGAGSGAGDAGGERDGTRGGVVARRRRGHARGNRRDDGQDGQLFEVPARPGARPAARGAGREGGRRVGSVGGLGGAAARAGVLLLHRWGTDLEAQLVAAQQRSATLESTLQQVDGDGRVMTGREAALASALEDRIAVIDGQLAERRAKEMAALNLWRQRADLMQQLVQVRVTRANYVGL